jgi:hypothetical protein
MPVRAHRLVDLVHAELAQAGRHEGGGRVAVEAESRALVEVAAPRRHVGGIACDGVDDGHGDL